MAVYFFDSSALVKRYAREAGSDWVVATTDPAAGHGIYVAGIAGVEVTSAIARRSRGGGLDPADGASILAIFRDDLAGQYQIVSITESIIDAATRLAEAHALRAYDAVQLASAVALQAIRDELGLPPSTLVSSDLELNAAAVAEGLLVDDPNGHP